MNEFSVSRPRFMIAGSGSGDGKTTLTCAVLRAFLNRGVRPAAFKCGPDYIDPMFHTEAIGVKSKNLDLHLCDEQTVRYLLAKGGENAGISVAEGVMGLYDGVGGGQECSSNHLSVATDTPVVLVTGAKGVGLSLAAKLSGFLRFRPNNIKGVILNGITPAMYPFFRDMIERELSLKVYGYLPHVAGAQFKSRHLGLITAREIDDIKQRLDLLAEACERTVDLDALFKLAEKHANFTYTDVLAPEPPFNRPVRVGVAKDKAFCFYYEDSLALLEKLGARLIYFSPLKDAALPDGLDGLIIGGGYPEEYLDLLSGNTAMLQSVKQAADLRLPIIAECGGFMYLCRSIMDKGGKLRAMAGVIEADCRMGEKLSNFGYIKLTAKKDNLLCRAGESVNGHEFHYSESSSAGDGFTAVKASGKAWPAVHATDFMFAGYPHLHLWGGRDFARNFIEKCYRWREAVGCAR